MAADPTRQTACRRTRPPGPWPTVAPGCARPAGTCVYTYISTLLEVLRAGAGHVAVVVLDRPVPINGRDLEGNVLDEHFASFVGPPRLAMRYGMTIGELARFFNAELGIGADLTVVPLDGWQRTDWYDQTGLPWVNPSPNIRSLTAATLYPGTVLIEGTNLSEGRGTEHPFEWIGAPWLDGAAWADALNALEVPGVRFAPVRFTPTTSKFAGTACRGVQIEVADRSSIRPMALGITLLATARSRAAGQLRFTPGTFDALAGTDRVRTALERGQPASEIASAWTDEITASARLAPRTCCIELRCVDLHGTSQSRPRSASHRGRLMTRAPSRHERAHPGWHAVREPCAKGRRVD